MCAFGYLLQPGMLLTVSNTITSGVITLPTALDETYVYRAYCRCGDLLYVGITSDLFNRLAGHRRAKAAWEPQAVRLEWELHPSRRAAERVESRLIRTLHPIHNMLGAVAAKNRPPRWRDLPGPVFLDEAP